MSSTTVRISEELRETLRRLADATGEPMNKVLERSVRGFQERWLLEEANRAYARLRDDPEQRQSYEAEASAWDASLLDGLGDEPVPRKAGKPTRGTGRR